MEGKPEESGTAEEAAPPSVAKLAGLFGDKITTPRKEPPPPPHKPTRKKPPCSLPLPKPEVTNNGSEKVSPPHSQAPKVKVKSSPLIEKLQANLAFPPTALLPGGSPKSPGLRVMASPFTSPPSTPSSPSIRIRASESDESPVSFEQPPEGAPLASYTKVRTRGSLKRRPPSRRFRKSQTDLDFDIDAVMAKENGDKVKEEDAESEPNKEESAPEKDASEKDASEKDALEKDTPPADKPSEISPSDPTNPERDGEGEKQSEAATPETTEEKEDNVTKEEETLDTGLTDTTTEEETEETANTEEARNSQEKTESCEPDTEDKPEQ